MAFSPSLANSSDESTSHEQQFSRFVLQSDYPCLAARSAFRAGAYRTGRYARLGTLAAARALASDLRAFIAERPDINHRFATFVAFFEDQPAMTEAAFEQQLWQQLGQLNCVDTQPWDPTVSSDPESSEFGFSFGGEAFFIIGLHPGSQRLARQFACPTLVFNAHAQFEQLRHEQKYTKMKQVIRQRDQQLQGAPNPMLADFGTASEARQYSGRAVAADWKCPFHAKTAS